MESQSPQTSFHIPRHLLTEAPIATKSSSISPEPELRILAAVIIGFALLLLLFTFFWCMLRSSTRSPNQKENHTESLDRELVAFPVTVYGGGSTIETEDCAICLEEYEIGDAIRVLPKCKHMFHKVCLEKWIQVPSLHCPICRDRILERLILRPPTNCRIAGNYPILAFPGGSAI